jgi:hypothetical protein
MTDPGARPDRLGAFPSIIDAVKTPLGFFSLVILLVSVVVLAAAKAFPQQQSLLIGAAIVWISIALFAVPALAVRKPEALYGQRPWQPRYARQLADDVYMALEGVMANLPSGERAEAWLSVADVVESDSAGSELEFSVEFAARLRRRANLVKPPTAPGAVAAPGPGPAAG